MTKGTTFFWTFWRSTKNAIKLIAFSANRSTELQFFTTWTGWFTHFLVCSQKEFKWMILKTLSLDFKLFLIFLDWWYELTWLVVFLKFLNRRKNSWAQGRIERAWEMDRWRWDRFDKKGVWRALKRASVAHHFPIRYAFGAESFVTGTRAFSRFEGNRIADMAFKLIEKFLAHDGILKRESFLFHVSSRE